MSAITLEAFFAAIVAHTEALNANTAALTGGAAAATTKPAAAATTTKTTTAKTTTTKPAATAPKGPTREEMVAALTEVKTKLNSDEAKALISEHGGVEKMAAIPDNKIKAVYDAAVAKLAEPEGGEQQQEDDGL